MVWWRSSSDLGAIDLEVISRMERGGEVTETPQILQCCSTVISEKILTTPLKVWGVIGQKSSSHLAVILGLLQKLCSRSRIFRKMKPQKDCLVPVCVMLPWLYIRHYKICLVTLDVFE